MAKRKCDVVIRNVVGNLYEAWMDDAVVERARELPSVQEVYKKGLRGAPWGIKFDPRYEAAEVIAEIKALADGREPCKGDTLDSLKAEAQDLGNRVDRAGFWSTVGMEYVRAAVAGRSYQNRAWLHSMHREIGEILSGEPQPEQSLAEAARALGQKAGAAGIPFTVAKEFLKAAEKTYGKSYVEVLPGIIRIVAERIEFGHWC